MTDPPSTHPEEAASARRDSREETTRLLVALTGGDDGARERLLERLYRDLRRLAGAQMAGERDDHTLEPTALVHEAYLRLVDQRSVRWQSRAHFFALASRLMRRILVDHSRRAAAEKRGGQVLRVPLEQARGAAAPATAEFLELEAALEALEAQDALKVKIVEMRFFGGLDNAEIAELLELERSEVATQWRLARAWLFRKLSSR